MLDSGQPGRNLLLYHACVTEEPETETLRWSTIHREELDRRYWSYYAAVGVWDSPNTLVGKESIPQTNVQFDLVLEEEHTEYTLCICMFAQVLRKWRKDTRSGYLRKMSRTREEN